MVNGRGKFLVCTVCRRAILRSIALAHAKGHNLTLPKKLEVTKTIQSYDVLTDIEHFNTTIGHLKKPVAYEGIDVIAGYKCQHCTYVSTTRNTVQVHLSQTHSDLPHRHPPKATRVQVLYLSPNDKVVIEVQERLDTIEATNLMAAWVNHSPNSDDDSKIVLATRELPPWLKTLGWLKLLEDLNPADIADFLVRIRKSNLYKLVSRAIACYLHDAMEHLSSMLLQIRQTLKSVTW